LSPTENALWTGPSTGHVHAAAGAAPSISPAATKDTSRTCIEPPVVYFDYEETVAVSLAVVK
jgi:hypothetical protein